MSTKKQSWLIRNFKEIKDTIAPIYPNDSKFTKFRKEAGFAMFLVLLSCATIGILIAVSFAH
ncbi:hypothetical protein ORI89_07625 [Sphingobacterium sp. UT-1RO-CII-1]|uniref:hypothetical protein n=1 Tax=Sphingobacterium sp. UT-1RO-CII-1 TaxID=2995225 RepID=UPI00227AA69C|nr:hypothetical protein [Sphingobacterium sp. UT-1RO-CII-1]MCY4779515.1 hypothetical protein [Sphingobacterium sp. UT-1RO-CII-1]